MAFTDLNFDLTDYMIDKKNCNIDNIKKMCICCFKISENNIYKKKFNDITLGDILEKCASVQLQRDDSLPDNMCDICTNQLLRTYLFICKFNKSQEIWHELLNTKTEVIEYVEDFVITDTDENVDDIIIEANEIIKEELVNSSSNEITYVVMDEEKKEEIKPEPEIVEIKTVKRPRAKKYQCTLCPKSFPYPNALNKHIRTHSKEKPEVCDVCSMRFTLRRNLLRHKMIHSGEKPYTCNFCGKGFIQKFSLTEHERIHTGEMPFVCNYCGKSFKRGNDLKAHNVKHLIESDDLLESEQELLNKLKCDVCDKIFGSKSILRIHQLIHGEKTFLCSQCGKSFVSNLLLKSHMKTHTGLRPFACEYCEKTFTQRSAFKDHILIHTGERPYLCEVCNKTFVQRNHLVYHLRTHSGEKPYKCKFCDKAFAIKWNLTVHTRIHTGECPFTCSVCSKNFYSSSSLKSHQKVHRD